MSEKLDSAISNYRVISAITKKAQTLTLSNDKYISEFNLPLFGKKFKDRKKDVITYFDDLNSVILEHTYLELFASFEPTIIDKIKHASGEMSKTIKNYYCSFYPFVNSVMLKNSILNKFNVIRIVKNSKFFQLYKFFLGLEWDFI